MANDKSTVDGFLIPLTVEEGEKCDVLKGTRKDFNAYLEEQGISKEMRELVERTNHAIREKAAKFLCERMIARDFKQQRMEIITDEGQRVYSAKGPEMKKAGVPAKGQSADDIPEKLYPYTFTERITVRADEALVKDNGVIKECEDACLKAWEARNKKK